MSNSTPLPQKKQTKLDELKALGFIVIVLFPLLSVVGVGGYGFIIWMMQAFGGVAGH